MSIMNDHMTREQAAQLIELKIATTRDRARAARADADLAESLAEAASLSQAKDERKWRFQQAGDDHARIARFSVEVTSNSCSTAIDVLSRWDRLDSEDDAALLYDDRRPFTLYITSGGGEIMPGIGLYSFLKQLASKRPLTTIASGLCASMATVIHQAGSTRLIERASSYLIHDASAGAVGNVHSLQDTATWIGRINDDLHGILAERSTLSKAELSEKARRRDWTLTATETVEYGFADRVIG